MAFFCLGSCLFSERCCMNDITRCLWGTAFGAYRLGKCMLFEVGKPCFCAGTGLASVFPGCCCGLCLVWAALNKLDQSTHCLEKCFRESDRLLYAAQELFETEGLLDSRNFRIGEGAVSHGLA